MTDKADKADTSLARMLSVLDLFSDQRLHWSAEDISETLGVSLPTSYRYLKTLSDAGLLLGHCLFPFAPAATGCAAYGSSSVLALAAVRCCLGAPTLLLLLTHLRFEFQIATVGFCRFPRLLLREFTGTLRLLSSFLCSGSGGLRRCLTRRVVL
jgi:hypothetical protein